MIDQGAAVDKVTLTRIAKSAVGSYGVMAYRHAPLCVTVERPDLNNAPFISCIPIGTFRFKKYLSPKNGVTWISQDVPGRPDIEIHAANVPKDVEGCCGVGQYFATFLGVQGVANSQPTMSVLRNTLPDVFDLVVTENLLA